MTVLLRTTVARNERTTTIIPKDQILALAVEAEVVPAAPHQAVATMSASLPQLPASARASLLQCP